MANTIQLKREYIYDLIWSIGLGKASVKLACRLDDLLHACRDNNIPLPDAEYFHILQNGGTSPKKPLPKSDIDTIVLPIKYKRRKSTDHTYGSKANTICILQILEDYSGENQELSVNDIIRYMQENYRSTIDRRTVYGAIDLLDRLEYDIITTKKGGKNFYALIDDTFNANDIKMILDSIELNPILPDSDRKSLYDRVIEFMPNRSQVFNARSWRRPHSNTGRNIYQNLDIIDSAFLDSKKLCFTYMHYNASGELVPKETYTVAPYSLVMKNYTYYLMCKGKEKNCYDIYRIDRMCDLTVSNDPFKAPSSLLSSTSDEFGDEIVIAHLKCDITTIEHLTDNFADRLDSIRFHDNNDGKTTNIEITAGFNELALWAASVADKCEVLEPLDLREAVIDKIKNNKYGV